VSGTLLAIAACSEDGTSLNCRVGADCVSGICNADGQCAPAVDGGPSASSSSSGDGGHPNETNPDAGHDDGGGLKGPGCIQNNDGTITRDEVPILPGLHGTFRFADNVEISTAGKQTDDGGLVWDYSADLQGDGDVLVQTLPLDDKWYGPDFPGASYSTQLARSPDLLAIFQYDSNLGSLALRGEASSTNGPYKTELTNDPPVEVIKFPLQVGKSWSTTTHVTGVAPNPYAPGTPSIKYDYVDKYDNEVDTRGNLVTPLGTFDVMRVKILLTRTFPATDATPQIVFTTRQFAFITECYGNVASVVSNANEPNEEFTHASEVRRIAP
jgi:hypothetical protein